MTDTFLAIIMLCTGFIIGIKLKVVKKITTYQKLTRNDYVIASEVYELWLDSTGPYVPGRGFPEWLQEQINLPI